ncbi:unnamed protein product [Chondrus crispus]|uniref:Uncharacterized protein n=1 Tax=Chondrus crispus TaxID=2769 RepID=R7QJ74_CHOCR|nr:unnamed protein product [Chondrus crispus]CDF37460.1 unnamed protein product [Chondrus crispus]|eukprot:XP_005717279.1 unnamed protein product [Chondrus crispus]
MSADMASFSYRSCCKGNGQRAVKNRRLLAKISSRQCPLRRLRPRQGSLTIHQQNREYGAQGKAQAWHVLICSSGCLCSGSFFCEKLVPGVHIAPHRSGSEWRPKPYQLRRAGQSVPHRCSHHL